jgi:hypothetical protein
LFRNASVLLRCATTGLTAPRTSRSSGAHVSISRCHHEPCPCPARQQLSPSALLPHRMHPALGGFLTRAENAPGPTLTPRPASENLHHCGHSPAVLCGVGTSHKPPFGHSCALRHSNRWAVFQHALLFLLSAVPLSAEILPSCSADFCQIKMAFSKLKALLNEATSRTTAGSRAQSADFLA